MGMGCRPRVARILKNYAEDAPWQKATSKTICKPFVTGAGKQVVFGHTPSKTGRAYTVDTGDICIDAACVYGGRLCALVIQDDGNSLCMYVKKNEEDDF